jgi:HAD superfamily hydrolase (TIGR01509 family)
MLRYKRRGNSQGGIPMKNDKVYIFDLTGVLFKIDKLQLIRQLGLWNTLMYAITQRKNPVNRYLEALHELSLRETQSGQQLQHYDYKFPCCVSDFYRGNALGSDVANILISGVEILAHEGFFASEREYELIKHITILAFATDIHTPSFKPIKPMIKLLKELRAEPSVKLYLLSNLDKQSYSALERAYPDFFALFDGVTISALVHMIKPYNTIYQHVFDTYQVDPKKTLFLDDQPENVAAGRAMGLKSVRFISSQQAITAARDHLKGR